MTLNCPFQDDAASSELQIKFRAVESAPLMFGDQEIIRLAPSFILD
jgi:hypothetical protein